jgi:hypothetical protein
MITKHPRFAVTALTAVLVATLVAASAAAAGAKQAETGFCRAASGIQTAAHQKSSASGSAPNTTKMRNIAAAMKRAAKSAGDPNVANALTTMARFFDHVVAATNVKRENALLTNTQALAKYSAAQQIYDAYYAANCPATSPPGT